MKSIEPISTQDDHEHISSTDDSLLTLIDTQELMSEDVVVIIDFPEFGLAESVSDTGNNTELLEFDF